MIVPLQDDNVPPHRHWRRRLRRILLIAGICLGATLVVLWFMFAHIPAWYRPATVLPADLQATKDDLVRTLQGFSDALMKSPGPFEYRLTQDSINSWLAARLDIWPLSRHWLPPDLSEPYVMLEQDAIRIAATYRASGIQTVASARFAVSGNRDGISVRLLELCGGSLPVPTGWLRQELAGLDRTVWPAGRTSRMQYSRQPLPPLASLLDEALFPGSWIWQPGQLKLPFWITSVKVSPGAIVFSIEQQRQTETR